RAIDLSFIGWHYRVAYPLNPPTYFAFIRDEICTELLLQKALFGQNLITVDVQHKANDKQRRQQITQEERPPDENKQYAQVHRIAAIAIYAGSDECRRSSGPPWVDRRAGAFEGGNA